MCVCVCEVILFCDGSPSARDTVTTSMVSIYIELEPHSIYFPRYICFASGSVSVRRQSFARTPPVRMHLYLSCIFHSICRYALVCVFCGFPNQPSKSFYFAIGQIYYIFRPLAATHLTIYIPPSHPSLDAFAATGKKTTCMAWRAVVLRTAVDNIDKSCT